MSRETLILLIWEALKRCGMDYITVPQNEMDWAIPFIREQGSLAGAQREEGGG